MERKETEDILRDIRAARQAGQRVAIASVVRVKGSAYRREGARMLVRDDGAMTCMLSGGCLEPEVVEVAVRVIESGQPALTSYDLEEDVVWGLGIGCGGSVDVRIERLDFDALQTPWLEVLERAALGVLATPLSDGHGRALFSPHSSVGALEPPELHDQVLEAAHAMMQALYPRAETRAFTLADGSSVDVFLDASAPAPELVIFGAGHDAIPLHHRGRDLGWEVTVVDQRSAFATPERFPGARIVLARPEQFASHVSVGPRSFVMVMNHHLERDTATLGFAVDTPAPFIGVLGPRSRYHKIVDALAPHGVELTPERLARVRSPVGLDIGAESPDEVALSIMAELIAVRRGFAGGLLNGREGRIHDPVVEVSGER